MRYACFVCNRPATSELPADAEIRAILVCPDCIEQQKVILVTPAEPTPEPEEPRGRTN